MDEKIKKLLSSKNEDDILIGWELLKSPENAPIGNEWHPYFDIIRCNKNLRYNNRDIMIKEIVGTDFINNDIWLDWKPENIQL